MKTLPKWLKSIIKYFSSSISKKIITPYALLTLVLAAMGVFIVTQLVAGSFEERLKNQLLSAGQVVSDEVVNRERLRLEIERVVANTIGVADALIDRDIKQLDELISPVIANAKIIDSIIIVDTQAKEVLRFQRVSQGTKVTVKTDANTGLDFSIWPAVTKVLADPKGFKEIQLTIDPELNEYLLYTIGPIQDSEDNVVGAALVGTYLDNEVAVLHELALAQLTLFDREGQILATTFALNENNKAEIFKVFTPQRYQEVLKDKDNTLLDQVQLSSQEGTVVDEDRERGYRIAYAPFVLRGREVGVYAVALSTNFITETTYNSQNWLVALFSVGVVTVFGIGWITSQRIIQPILRLVRTSQAISGGDLNQRTGLKRVDEIGILATAFDDMTDELQRLLQIQKEEASKLNAILNSIADGVIVQDINSQILIMNPAAEAILGDLGQSFVDTAIFQEEEFNPAEQVTATEYTTFFLNSLTGLEFKEAQRFPIGQQVLSALSAPVLTPDGKQLGSVVVLRDITREVESEKLKDEFITSISHELKTPLTAIKGYNTLLKMMLEMNPGDGNERQISIIKTTEKEVTDLDNIIQAMLDISQIDAGELGVDQVPINLTELIKRESDAWHDKMAERELSFTLTLPDSPVWVEGDHSRLTRVIHNLIKNAHDYTLPEGEVEVFVTQENGQGQVDIIDTGVGIKEEDQRFLFTKFFRAVHEESHFGDVSGVGLGLYTSKAIIEAHNGELWMEKSKVYQGSKFSFALPVIEPEIFDEDE